MKKQVVSLLVAGAVILGGVSPSFATEKLGYTLDEQKTKEVLKNPNGRKMLENNGVTIDNNGFAKPTLEGKTIKASGTKASTKASYVDPTVGELHETTYDNMMPYKDWAKGYNGYGVKVAVIDTGIDTEHPDLKVWGGVSYVTGVTSYDDDNGHGTHVGGIIGAKKNGIGVIGIAPESKLYAVKVLDKNGNGTVPAMTKGVEWSIANNMDVINLSVGLTPDEIGTPEYRALRTALANAVAAGITVVAASGNDSAPSINYPARFPDMIAVGGVDDVNDLAYFSNWGAELSLAAPAFLISTYPMDKTDGDYKGYTYMWGTSMASPAVAGMAALWVQQSPNSTPQYNKQIMTTHSMWHYDINAAGFDEYTGYGLSSFKNMN